MKRLVEILAVVALAAVFSGCNKEGTIVVQNNTGSTYSWELLDSDILGQTFAANESKSYTTTLVDRYYDFVATQKDGYFEHPNVVRQNKLLSKKGSVIFKIESRPAYIKYVNITNDNYQVDITCAANSTIKQINLPGRTLDSLEVEAGYSYNLKFTQLDGYVLYPSTREYTVNADCGYIYTYETPNLVK
ncbi:MAG: hypothetical protein J6T63_01855 [Bacteroidales bacterium]|nr:hypothetical protein [Bacteroidales bacterium]